MDKYKNKTTKDLKNMLEDYKKSQLDLLDFNAKKIEKIRNAREKLFNKSKHTMYVCSLG